MSKILDIISIEVPVYVTRKNANGIIGSFSINGWVAVAALFLWSANAILWGIAGILIAIRVIF